MVFTMEPIFRSCLSRILLPATLLKLNLVPNSFSFQSGDGNPWKSLSDDDLGNSKINNLGSPALNFNSVMLSLCHIFVVDISTLSLDR